MPSIPQPGTRDAPKFNEDEPTELIRFLERIEDIFEAHPTDFDTEQKKKTALGKYASARTEMEWRAFDTYANGTWAEFKREIIDSYPEALRMERGSISNLQKICDKHGGRLAVDSNDHPGLAALVRAFRAEAKKLLEPPALVSNRDLVVRFFSCLTPDFGKLVESRLSIMRFATERLGQPAATTGGATPAAPIVPPPRTRQEDLYTLDDVIATAQNIVETSRLSGADSHSRISTRGSRDDDLYPDRPNEALVKMEEKIAMLADTLINAEKRQTIRDKQFQELQSTLVTLKQALATGPPAMPPPQQAYPFQQRLPRGDASYGMQGGSPGCFYCLESGHMMMECIHALKHLDLKWIVKNEQGRLRLPNGGRVPNNVGKSMKETVEQMNKNRPGVIPNPKGSAASSFYQDYDDEPSMFSQAHYQLANEYNISRSLLALSQEYGADAMERVLAHHQVDPYDDDPVMENFP